MPGFQFCARFRPLSETKKGKGHTPRCKLRRCTLDRELFDTQNLAKIRGRALLVFRGDCAPRESCPRRAIGRRARPGGWLPKCDCTGRYDVSGEQAAGAVTGPRGVHEAVEKTGVEEGKKGGVLTRDTGTQRDTTQRAKEKKRGDSPPHLTRDETRRRT